MLLEYFSLIAKFTCSKLDTNQKKLHVQNIQTWKVDNPYFFQMFFFLYQMCIFEHIWLKSVLNPENYGFWKCVSSKSCSCLCDRGHECIIYIISNQFGIKMYKYQKCNVNKGTWNTNFKVINQHKNDMCYVKSLEMHFYLGALNSFDHVFTHHINI